MTIRHTVKWSHFYMCVTPCHYALTMESYMEVQDSYGSLFEEKSKYDAVMIALAGVIYREMRSKKTVDYRKIERDEQVQMVAEEPVKYGK